MRHSNTPEPTPFTLEKFPCSMRMTMVATLAATIASRPANHFVKGVRPPGSTYSTIRTTPNSNINVTIEPIHVWGNRVRAGSALLWAVAGFGAATICFALATSGWLAFAMLFFTGVFDSISVVLRLSLVQMRTPDHLRGRGMAVEGFVIAGSDQEGAGGWGLGRSV